MTWLFPTALFLVAGGPTTEPADAPVQCSNEAGQCQVLQDSGSCDCADGTSAAWSDGFNPDDPAEPKTDEELLAACNAALLENCGEDPPSLPPTCQGEVLTECEAFVAQLDALLEACGEDVPEVNIGRVGDCCDQFENSEYATYRDCVLSVQDPTCDALESCESMGGTDQDDGAGSPESAEDDTDATGGSKGCSVVPRTDNWQWLALLGLLPALSRRRR